MKIIADEHIPFLKGVLEPFADVEYMPGNQITRNSCVDADALLVRTRTRCNRQLLENTRVKFIGTATIGFDHIDTAWCEQNGIIWKNAPGCNAASVNQYVAAALVRLSAQLGFSLADKTLGVVGVGHVGRKVVRTAELLGMRVYLCDPPMEREGLCGFISLEGILRECDIITFHVPLTHTGIDKTEGMIGTDLVNRVNRGTILINTSRGEIADEAALLEGLNTGKLGGVVLDVWQNEPDINKQLLQAATIATPHVAGYSTDGKARGTQMIVEELDKVFGLGLEGWQPDEMPLPPEPEIRIDCVSCPFDILAGKLISHSYDILHDDALLRLNVSGFEQLRSSYPVRREYGAFRVLLDPIHAPFAKELAKMGFTIHINT